LLRAEVRKKKPSVIDVARLAGVDHSTVSRFLNNNPNVAVATGEKIRQAIKMTGYKPFGSARSLVLRRHETVGLVFEKEHVNTFYGARLIEGVTEKLSETGNRLAMGMIRWYRPATEIEDLPLLRMHSIDGLILDVAQISGDLDAVVYRLGLPYVYVNPAGGRPFNTIIPNDVSVAKMAVQYLIDRGHRKIGYIPCYKETQHSSQPDRMKGYVEAILQAGLQPVPLWDKPLEEIHKEDSDYDLRLKIYRQEYGCTAIVANSGTEALRMLFACYKAGVKVPAEMAMIGCDFTPTMTETPVPIPCIHLDRLKMGQRAVQMLMERIKEPERDIPTVYFEGSLIEDPRNWYGPKGLLTDEAEANENKNT
jgi:DNA-binding LacI/PurR family transcriptional regulator